MPEVVLKNITKIYDNNKKAVDNVSMTIADKEFVVLVGPSGCGKSTTLRMIAGLEEISGGELYIDNKLVNDVAPKDRDIAMVFQNYALYPHMSVYENMALSLKLRKEAKEDIKDKVLEAAKILDIEDLLDKKPKHLSGGQKQRVAVGRAMVRKPKVFLFDEPLSNLDAKLRVQMRTEISKLTKNIEATVVYVTHDQVEAMTMGDRIVIMNNGVIQQIDTPMNLYKNPVNKFVAGFIGSPAMNFLSGTILREQDLYFCSEDKELKFKLNDKYYQSLESYIDKKITLGIRAENIYTSKNGLDSSIDFKAVLDLVEPLGEQTFIYFTICGSQFVASVNEVSKNLMGSRIDIHFDGTKLYFFDHETEMLIS